MDVRKRGFPFQTSRTKSRGRGSAHHVHDLLTRLLRFKLCFVLNSKVAFIVEAVSLIFFGRDRYVLLIAFLRVRKAGAQRVECKNAISQPKFCLNRIRQANFGPKFYFHFWFFVVIPAVPVTQISFFFHPFLSFNLAIKLNFNLHRKCIVFYATGGLFDLVITYFYH